MAPVSANRHITIQNYQHRPIQATSCAANRISSPVQRDTSFCSVENRLSANGTQKIPVLPCQIGEGGLKSVAHEFPKVPSLHPSPPSTSKLQLHQPQSSINKSRSPSSSPSTNPNLKIHKYFPVVRKFMGEEVSSSNCWKAVRTGNQFWFPHLCGNQSSAPVLQMI
nr:hypothetical protein Iba_chr04bCG5000 [Ipomoea batatas]